jgi:hypothetical protein
MSYRAIVYLGVVHPHGSQPGKPGPHKIITPRKMA